MRNRQLLWELLIVFTLFLIATALDRLQKESENLSNYVVLPLSRVTVDHEKRLQAIEGKNATVSAAKKDEGKPRASKPRSRAPKPKAVETP